MFDTVCAYGITPDLIQGDNKPEVLLLLDAFLALFWGPALFRSASMTPRRVPSPVLIAE
jgi:hypothetical protein